MAIEFRGLDVPDTSCDSIKAYPDLIRAAVNATDDVIGMVVIPYQPPPGCDVDVLGAVTLYTGPIIADNPAAACLAFTTPPCGLCAAATGGSDIGSLVTVDAATKSWTLSQAGDAIDGVCALAAAMQRPDECPACVDCAVGPGPAPAPVSPPVRPTTPSPMPIPSPSGGGGGAASAGRRTALLSVPAALLWAACFII